MRVSHTRRRVVGVLIVVGIVAAATWLLLPPRRFDTSQQATLAEILPDIAKGAPGAVDRARRIARRDWPQARPVVQRMLAADSWRIRAVACEILADRPDPAMLAALIPRCNDVDWRVRAAANEAISHTHPMPAARSLRDMPLDERDRLLLAWLDELPADGPEPLANRLCELYAGARHVEFSRVLAERCLACHAGSPPRHGPGDCGNCHGAIDQQWSKSAHADSLTHLSLQTIVDGEVKRVDFGELRGMDCTACHRIAGGPAPAPQSDRCPYTFAAEPAERVCGRCHGPTVRQWRTWRSGTQPRRPVWPPGQVDPAGPPDERDCADCHMPPEPQPGGRPPLAAHRWQARRNRSLLADGIALRIGEQSIGPDGGVVRLTLINLSGHDYPTGTRRRAVRLYAGPDNTELTPLVTLRPPGPGAVDTGGEPALAPGEQRHFDLPVRAGTTDIFYMLIYHRDLADPDGYTAEILSGGHRLSPWR